jgi:hypothetical protein
MLRFILREAVVRGEISEAAISDELRDLIPELPDLSLDHPEPSPLRRPCGPSSTT